MPRSITLGATPLVASALAVAAIIAPAQAENFCPSDADCVGLKIENNSFAIVKQVRVDQEKTDGLCDAVTQKFTQNLSGINFTGGESRGESFTVQVYPSCKYKIKYGTTSGCAGDKVTHMKPSNFDSGKDLVQLIGPCGTLTTTKIKEANYYGE